MVYLSCARIVRKGAVTAEVAVVIVVVAGGVILNVAILSFSDSVFLDETAKTSDGRNY